jgi:hypothetical protein
MEAAQRHHVLGLKTHGERVAALSKAAEVTEHALWEKARRQKEGAEKSHTNSIIPAVAHARTVEQQLQFMVSAEHTQGVCRVCAQVVSTHVAHTHGVAQVPVVPVVFPHWCMLALVTVFLLRLSRVSYGI